MAGKSINELTELTDINGSGLMALSNDGSTLGRVNVSTLQNSFIGQHVTNYIKSISQDIKLELNNGTLTLKAGSKVYVPNGAGIFDVVTVPGDVSITWGYSDKRLLCYKNGTLDGYPIADIHSGTSAPSSSQWMIWYDTSNNAIKKTDDSGSTWDSGWSFPICAVTTGEGVFTSIDQVFNGFGYVGSTIFALPGITAEMPNGKESNGVLKNTEFTTTEVKTYTFSSLSDFGYSIYLTPLGLNYVLSTNYSESFTVPTNKTGYALWLDKNTNLFYAKDFDVTDSSWTQVQLIGNVCKFNTVSGIISNFNNKEPLTLLDSNTLDNIPHIIETWSSDSAWYRVYSDGWCEQGNYFIGLTGTQTINLYKPYKSNLYNVKLSETYTTTLGDARTINNANKTASSFQVFVGSAATVGIFWEARGYIF